MFKNMFESKFNKLNGLIDEFYSLLAVCKEDSYVIISIVDDMKDDIMEIAIAGKSWMNNPNFATELKELNNILALNIKYNRTITIALI